MKGPHDNGAPHRAADAHSPVEAVRRRRWPRILAFVVIGLLGGGLAFLGGFAAFATHVARLTPPVEQPRADAIIVLTGGEKRLDAGFELLRSGKGRRLLISGVHPSARLIDLQAATGADSTLFSCCVDLDHAALDTIGNAEESAKWVDDHAWNSVIVVTSNYHMPRSLLELKRVIGGADILPYPVVNSRLDGGEWMTNHDALRVLFTEYAKYIAAVVRGMLPGPRGGQGMAMVEATTTGATR